MRREVEGSGRERREEKRREEIDKMTTNMLSLVESDNWRPPVSYLCIERKGCGAHGKLFHRVGRSKGSRMDIFYFSSQSEIRHNKYMDNNHPFSNLPIYLVPPRLPPRQCLAF